MKGQLVIAVFLGVIGVGLAANRTELELPHMKACANELSGEAFHKLVLGTELEMMDFYGLRACVWTNIGFLKGAKMDLPALEKYLKETREPEIGAAMFTLIKECQTESEVGDDPWMVAYYYLTCYKSKVQEQLMEF